MSEILRRPQIGVMGSENEANNQLAEETGLLIAEADATLVVKAIVGNAGGWYYPDSISRYASLGTDRGGGRIIFDDMDKGLFVLFSRSCDAIISIDNPLIIFTPSPTDWTLLKVNYVKTPREAVDIAMDKIMARRKAS